MSIQRGTDLVLASGNAGKLAEFSHLLAGFECRLLSLNALGLSEPEETEHSFAGNAALKARAAARATGMLALSDDSGLVIEGLHGGPGIYTADWSETGTGRDFRRAMTKTWALLRAIDTKPPFRAEFVCVLALARPTGEVETFRGAVAGQIVWPMRGDLGHGYDPIFQPDGHDLTMGEMDPLMKAALSHRARAVDALISACFT